MNIGLIMDPYGEKNPGGLGRAIFEIAKAIIEEGAGNSYTVFLKKGPAIPPAIRGNWRLVALGVKYLWLSAGRHFDRTLDAYIFFTPVIPLFFFPRRSIAVVHDFAYLEALSHTWQRRLSVLVLFFIHSFSLKKATIIVAVSQATKDSTVRHFRIKPEKIRVVYNGFISYNGAPEPMEVPEKFFLFAGVLKERKNVLGVIRAFAEFLPHHPDFSLLIAGKTGGDYFAQCQALVEELGVGSTVQFLGYVTDGQLSYLYTKATALVFPSFIEGFGMPVLEAMDRGLPVITSNEGALAEVAADAALLADPRDPRDMARMMALFADNPHLRDKYIRRGQGRAAKFSWAAGGREFCDILAKQIKGQ